MRVESLETTIVILLMLQRNLYSTVTMTKEARWADCSTYIGDEIYSKTLRIVGMVNIGKKVVRIATALGIKARNLIKK